MIRIYSADYTAKDFAQIAEILREGLSCVCDYDCCKCSYDKVCKSVNSAISYCDLQRSRLIYKKEKRI